MARKTSSPIADTEPVHAHDFGAPGASNARSTTLRAGTFVDHRVSIHGRGTVRDEVPQAGRTDPPGIATGLIDALSRIVGQIRVLESLKSGEGPIPVVDDPGTFPKIKALLAGHLGSDEAADAWLGSRSTGYPETALVAIQSGFGHLVLGDIEAQLGPSPSYA